MPRWCFVFFSGRDLVCTAEVGVKCSLCSVNNYDELRSGWVQGWFFKKKKKLSQSRDLVVSISVGGRWIFAVAAVGIYKGGGTSLQSLLLPRLLSITQGRGYLDLITWR
jgi:hypothetical protein